mgnify:FL=1
MYQPLHPFIEDRILVRDVQYHVLRWETGPNTAPPLVLCHGWMDVAASFQFLVDQLQTPRTVIAPDWRGFGGTATPQADHFVYADYLLDLDYLLDHYAGQQPVDLVGHSMGGNIVLQYAGVRPERIRKVINLEGFGLPATQAKQAPSRLRQWMDEVRALRTGELDLRSYDSAEQVAQRLQRTNPRLPADKAAWLAQHWSAVGADGRWHILAHAGHKIHNHQLYHVDEANASLAGITAPTLCVRASDNSIKAYWGDNYLEAEFYERMAHIPNVQHQRVEACGHMLHHDQPKAVAQLIEEFLA